MRNRLFFALATIALTQGLSSCSSPPRPPSVDESTRRPANPPGAVELHTCQSELHNARLLVQEKNWAVIAASANAARAQAVAARAADTKSLSTVDTVPNALYSIPFEFGSARLDLARPMMDSVMQEARTAPLVMLRGRTDGTQESPAEARIARARTEAVRDWLIRAGIAPDHIRATWQAVGDPLANNDTPAGRAANRRVEVEVYRKLPTRVASMRTS